MRLFSDQAGAGSLSPPFSRKRKLQSRRADPGLYAEKTPAPMPTFSKSMPNFFQINANFCNRRPLSFWAFSMGYSAPRRELRAERLPVALRPFSSLLNPSSHHRLFLPVSVRLPRRRAAAFGALLSDRMRLEASAHSVNQKVRRLASWRHKPIGTAASARVERASKPHRSMAARHSRQVEMRIEQPAPKPYYCRIW